MNLLSSLALDGRRVLIREDLNAPITNGRITSTKRLDAALPTIRAAMQAGAQVMLMSHLGRPTAGEFDSRFSLAPIADYLTRALGFNTPLCADYLTNPPRISSGEVVLLENVRFNRGETENDNTLARQYAALCDVFVMDAFATAHRAHASTEGVARHAPIACAGPLLTAELQALTQAFAKPKRPLAAIVGGAKVSSKLRALESLSRRVDLLIPGGGIANTFLKAAGANIGASLYEPRSINIARELMNAAGERAAQIIPPEDVVVAKKISARAAAAIKPINRIGDDDMILDIGPNTINRYTSALATAGTIIWNGPLGVFELPRFAAGTKAVGEAAAASPAFSIAGGGDTLAAVEQFNLRDKISYLSTGGGAFLTYLEGNPLPALAALQSQSKS